MATIHYIATTTTRKAGKDVNSLFADDSDPVANGMSAHRTENEAEAYAFARRLASLLPANNAEGIVEIEIGDDINRRADIGGDRKSVV